MTKMSQSEKRTAIIGLTFIVAFSLFWWVIRPTWTEYQNITAELAKLKKNQAQIESIAGMEKGFGEKVLAYQEAYQSLKSRYLSDMDEKTAVIKFLAMVEHLTKATEAEIVSENTGVSEVEGLKSVLVNLTLRCTPAQLTNLLQSFSTSQIVITVERLRIDVEDQNRLLQVRLTASTLIVTDEIAEEGEEDAAK